MAHGDYTNTYWNGKGKHEKAADALHALVPDSGEIPNARKNKALEKYRKACNCYYDLYNNGLCNRKAEFAKVFGFASNHRYGDHLTQELIDKTEAAMNIIIEKATIEQGIEIDGPVTEVIHAAIKSITSSKPKVKLIGNDGNVFSIIGKVSGTLKKAGENDKAKDFTDRAFNAKSYDEVLRLCMEYCEVS